MEAARGDHFSVCHVFTASYIQAGSEQLKSFPLKFKQCFSRMCEELLQMLPFLTLTSWSAWSGSLPVGSVPLSPLTGT